MICRAASQKPGRNISVASMSTTIIPNDQPSARTA
jgi:hypothetical protein